MLLLHDADDYSAPGSWRRTAAALPRVLEHARARGLDAGCPGAPDALEPRRLQDNIGGLSTASYRSTCRAPPLARQRHRRAARSARSRRAQRARAGGSRRWSIVWLCWVYDAINNLAPLRLHAGARARPGRARRRARRCTIDPELALDRWLAGHHTLGPGRLRLLRQRPLRRHARPARLAVVAARRHLPAAAQLAGPRSTCSGSSSSGATRSRRRGCSRGFTDVVASTHAFGSWHTGALASHANQLAAMPSLHIAWAVWCALALWRLTERAWVRALAAALPVRDGVRGARDRQPLPARRVRGLSSALAWRASRSRSAWRPACGAVAAAALRAAAPRPQAPDGAA